jgi:ketosteroid isomerase-like protein
MSQANVDLVRSLLWEGIDAAAFVRDDAAWAARRAEVEALFEPDCAFAWIAHGQLGVEATGLDEARAAWLEFFGPWESVHNETDDIIAVDDRVVVLTRTRGRLAASERDVELIGGAVYQVRNGKLAAAEFYATRDEALEAVGLRE